MPPTRPDDDMAWTAADPKAIAAALRALRERYRVTTARPVSVQRTWLDTADWRLHRTGHTLAGESVGGAAPVLHVCGPGGAAVVPDRPGAGWPRLLDGLPDGLPEDVADALAGVVGIRALMPVVE